MLTTFARVLGNSVLGPSTRIQMVSGVTAQGQTSWTNAGEGSSSRMGPSKQLRLRQLVLLSLLMRKEQS